MLFECGDCLRPNEDIISKIKATLKTLIAPCYLLLVKSSRGKKHGEQPWQEDHWEERPQKVPRSIIIPQSWTDGRAMNIQKFQSAVGWNDACCRKLAYICTVDISYIAPHHQRSRNDNTITMKSWRPRSSSGSHGEARRLQENNKRCCAVSEKSKRQFLHPEGHKNKAKGRIGPGIPRTIGVGKSTLDRSFL